MKKNLIIALMAFIILGSGSYIFWSSNRHSSELSNQSNQMTPPNPRQKQNSKPVEDPYLKNQVRNTILKQTAEIQICYKDFLKSKPKVTDGVVSIDWQIKPDGHVLSPQVIPGELKNQSLEKCLVSLIEKWSFPIPPDGLNFYVMHKFNFKKTE